MTQPDEATIPSGPEKAHGDALEDVVQAAPDGSADQADGGADSEPAD
jgi:hypothetical protein